MATETLAGASRRGVRTPLARLGEFWRRPEVAGVAASVALVIAGAAVSSGFASWNNLTAILAAASLVAIAAAGQTLVIIAGGEGIDLSIGSVMSFSAVIAAMTMDALDSRLPLALLLVVAVGAIIGLINALGIVYIGLPPLVMTLAVGLVLGGLIFVVSGGQATGGPSPLLETIGNDRVIGVPILLGIFLFFIVAVQLLLSKSRYGKQLYLVGTNRRAAFLCGLGLRPLLIVTYCLSSIFAALAGILVLGFIGTIDLSLGAPYFLISVAAAVVGGVQLSGGTGSYVGTAIGAIFLTLLASVLLTLHVSDAVRQILQGAVLLAVLMAYDRQPRWR